MLLIAKVAYFEYLKFCSNCGRPPAKDILELLKDYSNLSISYSSDNGSLPPPYHRENIITISTDKTEKIQGKYTIRDYKNVLDERIINVSPEQLKKLITSLSKINPESNDAVISGCTGGSSKSIKISRNEKVLLSVSAYNCSNKSSNESLEKFFSEAKSIIPI